MSAMVRFSHVIDDPEGFHARLVVSVCAAARAWESTVTVGYLDVEVSAKDPMGLMGICARKGDELTVAIEGQDEEACASALRAVFDF